MKAWLTIFAIMSVSLISAQSYLDRTLTSDFLAEVKSLDEFKARFNGDEKKPGVPDGPASRRDNILSLFDFNIEKGKHGSAEFQAKMNGFVDSILVNDNRFNISDSGLFAECLCKMIYKGKDVQLTLLFRNETIDRDRYRWAIVGIRGLEKAGIIKTDKLYSIDPVQHEVHFIGLHDFLNANPEHAFGYRGEYTKIDNLSVFYTLIYCGLLKFDVVLQQKYFYFDIPGYVFTIEEISRNGENSGWLITLVNRADDLEKTLEINRLLGYE